MTDFAIRSAAEAWASDLEAALAARDGARLSALFLDPSYLRDNGALTWDYRQFHGRDNVVAVLLRIADTVEPRNFRVSAKWPAPSMTGDASAPTVEAFFDFDTNHGSGVLVFSGAPYTNGSTRLRAKAVFTRLESLNGNLAQRHPRGRGYTASFPGQTWQQHRDAASRYESGEPDVIVVGAGQSGLTTAAYLRHFGVDVLVVDRHPKVGDSWGRRYDSLALHNPVEMNGFPFLKYPQHYPEYLSKDLIADWLDIYARYTDLNVWTSTEFGSARYDEKANRWTAVVRSQKEGERTLRPRHIVLATGGIGGRPLVPHLPGLDTFTGTVVHSSQYTRRADYAIDKAIIVGVATSANDIAADLTAGGVGVTMLQRGPVVINNVATANLAYAGYLDPSLPTELVDIRYGIGLINPLREAGSRAYHKMAREIDRELLTRLELAGLRLGHGVDGQGWLDLFLRTGGGYYLNTGTSELIADGAIKVEQMEGIAEFAPTGVRWKDGSLLEAGLVVLATGYQSRKSEVADAFGQDVADRVGEIARLDGEGEWANMWCQSGQRGLWFNGGGINQMRPGSERLALLIKADLDGLIPDGFRRPPKNSGAKASYEPIAGSPAIWQTTTEPTRVAVPG